MGTDFDHAFDMAPGSFQALRWDGVCTGTCVVLVQNEDGLAGRIYYAGPIAGAPIEAGMVVLLSGDDYTLMCAQQVGWLKRAKQLN